jgi:hypothetical protein
VFQTFLRLPPAAIFALINETDKKVYISHTTRLPTRLGEMVDKMTLGTWKFPAMTQDKHKLELKILEQSNTESRYFVQYFVSEYRNMGYTIYNETENLPKGYTFQIQYSFDTIAFRMDELVSVIAINSQYEKIVLGKFQHPQEAEDFLENVVKKNNPAGSLVFKI